MSSRRLKNLERKFNDPKEQRSAFLFAQAQRLLEEFGYGTEKRDPVGRVEIFSFENAELEAAWNEVRQTAKERFGN